MDPILIAFIGYIIGSALKTIHDAVYKILEDPVNFKWDHKYTLTFFGSLIISIISAMMTFTGLEFPTVNSQMFLFLFCATQGFAVNHVLNKPVSYLTKTREKATGPGA